MGVGRILKPLEAAGSTNDDKDHKASEMWPPR